MRAHIVENGVVVNTVVVTSLSDLPNLIDGEVGGIGWRYENGTLISPPQPEIPADDGSPGNPPPMT
jgi:hypothetical protein